MADHPITPPPELVKQWAFATESNDCIGAFPTNFEQRICTAAARWGAEQELEACCAAEHTVYGKGKADWLRSLRRPKPPSLKEQALEALEQVDGWAVTSVSQLAIHKDLVAGVDTIRRALEQLDD